MKVIVGAKTFQIGETDAADFPVAPRNGNGEYIVDLPPHSTVTSLTFIDPFLTVQYWRLDR